MQPGVQAERAYRRRRKPATASVINLKRRLRKKNGYKLPDGVVYVGRAMRWLGLKRSFWANPYVTEEHGGPYTLEESLYLYELRVRSSPEMWERLPELRGKILGCWCLPQRCHGHVLLELLEAL